MQIINNLKMNITKKLYQKCKEDFINLFTKKNIRITRFILPYLDYKEVLSLSLVCKSFHELIRSHKSMKSYVLKGKIFPENRLLFYITNLNISKVQTTIETELNEYNIKDNYYQQILQLANDSYMKDKKFKKVCDEIGRDLHRTFYIEKFNVGNGKNMLKNVLTAVGFIRPEIGYCQGMNFIAGALINLIDNEEKCFWIFLCFIDDIKLSSLYLKNMPDFLIRVYQLKKLIEFYFPKLGNHLKRNQINIDLFFSKWLLTIFSNYLPFDVLYKVWDVFIIDKWKALFKFCMILLDFMKENLLKMDLNSFSQYFRSNELLTSLSFEEIIKHYNEYKITNKQLEDLREEFFIEQVKSKLDNNNEWEDDQKELVYNYQNDLKNHLEMIKEPIEELQKKIEKINKDYYYKFEKYEKQFEIVSNLIIKIDSQNEAKNGYENILKRLSNKNEYNIENQNENINRNHIIDEKKNNEGILGSLWNLFSVDNSENAKILKKLKEINKNIDENNKSLEYNQKFLDKYKTELEICKNEKNILQQQLENIENQSKKTKRNLLKNLSEKLKLSAKFVATNKY